MNDERVLLLESLLRDAPEGVFMKDIDGRYLVANDVTAQALGFRTDEVVGKRDDELLAPEVARQLTTHDRAVLQTGTSVTHEETLGAPGSERVWQVSKGPVRNGEGRIVGIFGVARDVTESRRAEQQEHAARERAERTAAHLGALEMVTEGALALLSGEELVRELLDRVRRVFAADTSMLLLLREDTQVLEVNAAAGLEEEVTRRVQIPVGRGFSGTIAATRRPLVVADVSRIEIVSPVLRAAGIRSMLGVPVMLRGRLLGVLHIGTLTARDFDAEDVRLMQVVAGRVATALDGMFLFRAEREARAQAEAAEERYRALVNGLDHSIVWEADANTLWFTFVSAPAEKVLGYPIADWFTQPSFFAQRLHPDDRERVLRELRVAAVDRQDHKFDHRMIKADGSPIWVHTGITVAQAGAATVFHGITVDIDELKKAEEALRVRARQLAATADLGQHALAGTDVAALLDEAAARVARELDAGFVEILELLPERGRLLLRAGVGWEEGLVGHATIGADHSSHAGYTLTAGQPVIVEELGREDRFRPSSLLLGHQVVSGLAVAIPGTSGPFGVLAAHTRAQRTFTGDDVAFLQSVANLLSAALIRARLLAQIEEARARAEDAERRLTFLYQATGMLLGDPLNVDARVSDFAIQIVAAIGDLGCVHYVGDGAPRRFVLQRSPARGARVDIVEPPPGSVVEVPEIVAEVIRKGEAQLFSEPPAAVVAACEAGEMTPPAGSVPASAILAPIRARGHTYGAITLVALAPRRYERDDLVLVEELAYRAALALDNARLYEQVERAAREREELISVVAHDLRNALHSILLNAVALAQAPLDEATKKRIDRIRAAGDIMDRLTRSVLDAGALDAGRLQVQPAACDPGGTVREAVEALAPLAEARALGLTAHVPEGLPPVVCDRDRILQVLSNLIGNALKFTKKGEVRVSARAADGEVVFAVTDTGPGIREEELPHVFDRFWQARETAHKGSGLGLFIVKGIVEAHRGRVWAESRVGTGTTFFFALPVAGGRAPSPKACC
ncbi:MAG: GAF domain-containing protein [Minicystis sp.]